MTSPSPYSPGLASAKSPRIRSVPTLTAMVSPTYIDLTQSAQSRSNRPILAGTPKNKERSSDIRPVHNLRRNYSWPPAFSYTNFDDDEARATIAYLQKVAKNKRRSNNEHRAEGVEEEAQRFAALRRDYLWEVEKVRALTDHYQAVNAARTYNVDKKLHFRSLIWRRWTQFIKKSTERHDDIERGRTHKREGKTPPRPSPDAKTPIAKVTTKVAKDDNKPCNTKETKPHRTQKKNINLPPHELSVLQSKPVSKGEDSRGRSRPVFTPEGDLKIDGEGPLWESHGTHHRKSRTLSGHRHAWQQAKLFTVQEEHFDPDEEDEEPVGHIEDLRRAFGHRQRRPSKNTL